MEPVDEDLTPAERLEELLEEIADALDVDTEVTVTSEGSDLEARFDGDDVAVLIGHHGATLDAIQHIAYRIVFRGGGERARLTIDAGGYRERRAEALRGIADQAAASALRTGGPVALDGMSALERRVVHEHLKDRADVETHSEGQEPNRHLVVAPVV
ncbi:R3H domain-containing nucleic acid-binding protein [Conexibacter sp. DBS9H8]|uniref:Jag family protein n=1 Tax=Conexibacter sp. DBS9H8 TaxID=2937801 RepID=UPI00200DFE09|nr:R3H domain-containing nucleic acid-binding protein [Conexibacter sp. DBS9H8]